MNSQITIEIPEGKIAKQATNPDGSISITFIDKEPVRSKTWEEFCENHYEFSHEWYIDTDSNIRKANGVRGTSCSNSLETQEDAEGILALIQLTRLHDEWINNWKADYVNITPSNKKYQIFYDEDMPKVAYHYSEHHLLDFPTEELAKEFLECFEDIIGKAKKFL